MPSPSSHIAHIVYINLDRRTDRRTHMETVCTEYGMHAERFPAISHNYGLYGCGMSHLSVLKMAQDQQWKNVLIMEDDILMRSPSPQIFWQKIDDVWEKQPNFDVMMLDTNLQAFELYAENQDCEYVRVLHSYCAGAYIVKSHYYSKLIELYETALPRLLETQMHWIYANDAVWESLQRADKWITPRPQLCVQMDGYSDTKNMMITSTPQS